MRQTERRKAQEELDKILSGEFGEIDVEHVYMRLREYSEGHLIFREIAHFVAHSKTRKQGDAHRFLDRFICGVKYSIEFGLPGILPKITEPFPSYLKRHMKYQINNCNPNELRQKFRKSPKDLEDRIDKLFKNDKNTKIPFGHNDLLLIQHLLAFMDIPRPLFTSDDILEDLVAVLQKNQLSFDKDALMTQRAPIVLCVMLLIRGSGFEFDKLPTGKCVVMAQGPHPHSNEIRGDNFPEAFERSTLQLFFAFEAPGVIGPVLVFAPILSTDLLVTHYCDESLFALGQSYPSIGNHIFGDENLCLIKNSKKLGLLPTESEA
ncbi:MAG: hypothetical protein ABI618_09475 [Nitrospirota bacterium]